MSWEMEGTGPFGALGEVPICPLTLGAVLLSLLLLLRFPR